MKTEELDLKTFCEIVKKMEIGTGKPSKTPATRKLKWRESSGAVTGGSLYFYCKEISSDQKLSEAELKVKTKEVRKTLLSDLVASGAFSPEQLKDRMHSVIDLVVRAHDEIFRLRKESAEIHEGRRTFISGSIRFHQPPNIDAMLQFSGG